MNGLWESTLGTMRAKLHEETFSTWLEPIRFDGLEGRTVRLRIPNRFFADWISARYLTDLLEPLRQHAGRDDLEVSWVVDATLQDQVSSAGQVQAPSTETARGALQSTLPPALSVPERRVTARAGRAPGRELRASAELPLDGAPAARDTRVAEPAAADEAYALNPRYSFENFVVGGSNQLAYAAAVAAGSSPGRRYNPLVLYSKVGLGKTHLVNAVGHRVREDRPGARVLFLSAERFTNEFIWALQHKRIEEFRTRYRVACDVLILDDIQFLAGREQTQEEFFHTFNALYHADKQIVVTSDVDPKHIPEMTERLVSRFQWGLVADVQAPELDTRIAILQKKAEAESLHLPSEVALLIAQRAQNNVRELEGTLLRLAVLADAQRRPIDLELARTVLGGGPPQGRDARQISVEDVQRAACEFFQIGLRDLLGDRKHRNVSIPRMIAMYVCREHLDLSYPMIGARFGNKDHTTVMNAHRRIAALIGEDERIRRALESIEQKIGLA